MNHRERMALDRWITREPPEEEGRCPVCASRDAVRRVTEILAEYGWDVRRRVDGGNAWEDWGTDRVLSHVENQTAAIWERDGGLCDSCAEDERSRYQEDEHE